MKINQSNHFKKHNFTKRIFLIKILIDYYQMIKAMKYKIILANLIKIIFNKKIIKI